MSQHAPPDLSDDDADQKRHAEEGRFMPAPLSAEARALIDRPNFAHLATLMPDGAPQSAPVWVGREGDRLLVCTGEGSLKGRNTRRDPRVAVSIVDFRDPYEEVQLRGRVVERRPDPDLKIMDPVSQKYTGKPFPMRNPEGRVALVIEVDKVRPAVYGQTFKAPCGFTLTMDKTNHHLHKPVMIGEIQANGQFSVVNKTKSPIRAQPWSPFIAGNEARQNV